MKPSLTLPPMLSPSTAFEFFKPPKIIKKLQNIGKHFQEKITNTLYPQKMFYEKVYSRKAAFLQFYVKSYSPSNISQNKKRISKEHIGNNLEKIKLFSKQKSLNGTQVDHMSKAIIQTTMLLIDQYKQAIDFRNLQRDIAMKYDNPNDTRSYNLLQVMEQEVLNIALDVVIENIKLKSSGDFSLLKKAKNIQDLYTIAPLAIWTELDRRRHS